MVLTAHSFIHSQSLILPLVGDKLQKLSLFLPNLSLGQIETAGVKFTKKNFFFETMKFWGGDRCNAGRLLSD